MVRRFDLSVFSVLRIPLIIILCSLSGLQVYSQSISPIILGDIHQKNVRKYIESRSIDKLADFSSIHPTWKKESNESDYYVIEREFVLKYKLSEVWKFYRESNSFQMWNGQSIRFGLLITKNSNQITYSGSQAFPSIDTGQVYFLDVKLLKGILNVPLSFEIIRIDQEQKIVELSYIEHNISSGKQTLQFFDNGNGRTLIRHLSFFRSESAFRDEFLYPYFHEKFIKKFHSNIRRLLKKSRVKSHVLT
jgi:hypothetical protein